MNRKTKILKIFIFIVCALFCMGQITYAATGGDIVGKFNGNGGSDTKAGEKIITDVMMTVLSVVKIVTIGIGVFMITFLGIKYMSAAPSEKANIKTQLVAFSVGAILVVAATSILQMLRDATADIVG